MKKAYFIYLILFAVFFAGCSLGKISPTNYYILEYFDHLKNDNLYRETPLAKSVWIMDLKIPSNYNRKQIVLRHFGPKITYANKELWGIKLTEIIPNFIDKKLEYYNVFNSNQRDVLNERPEYIISSKITNIEFYKNEFSSQARLVMDLSFKKGDNKVAILQHRVNRDEFLSDDSFDNFVLKINDVILEEIDTFIYKIENYLEKGIIEKGISLEDENTEISFIKEERKTKGMGFLFLPSISNTDNEPYYTVYDQSGILVASARMGESSILAEGKYTVNYGSGSSAQLLTKNNVEIIQRYKTVVEPDWGILMVDVLDEERNFAKVRYEIFNAESGESFGGDFPADEEIGEKRRSWVLTPGLYKITINDEPFNTLRDFTTVLIEKGKLQDLRIVMGIDEDNNPTNLVGAGILSGSEILKASEDWKLSSSIHGNFNANSKNEEEKDKQKFTLTLTSQLENRLIYDKMPFHFTSKNIIDLGTTKNSGEDFRLSIDEFDLKNTFIYYFIKDIGFYSRFNINSHFFPTYDYYPDDSVSYKKFNENGDLITEATGAEKILREPAFYPLNLKEGIGLNMRLLNRASINLYFRTGFGMEQDIKKDVFQKDSDFDSTTEGYQKYDILKSEYKKGTELSLVGSIRFRFGLTYNTDAYILFPFDKSINKTVEWENTFNMKLLKYVSLEYKLKLENKELNDEEYIYNEHSLFLRLTYIVK